MRLYHSIALLLPDGRVLTGGGGAPGPVTNLNAEIYTPPYLYRQDLSGKLAARPIIHGAPAVASWGRNVALQTDAQSVRRVTLLRMGSATHSSDVEQRFMALKFSQSHGTVHVTMPASATLAPPGYYMLFVFRGQVPSVGHIIRLGD
ncbi:MAG: galactose oxidase early set domain-containing protein [Aquabacterium sp.]